MITKSELLKGRDALYPADYTQTISNNLEELLIALNAIRTAYGKPMIVDSGWRPSAINDATSNAAHHSKHLIGLAADIADPDGSLWLWVLANLDLMQKLGIYMEDKRWTPSWVHFQLGPPLSGHRIFIPSAAPALAPTAWNGVYDVAFNA
jgi:uncharacterized protein YcbK (DUF882 family)